MRKYLTVDDINKMSYFDFKMYVKIFLEKEEEQQKLLDELHKSQST
jgi:hypothetical protein